MSNVLLNRVLGRRGRGYWVDEPDSRDLDIVQLGLPDSVDESSASLKPMVSGVLDQRSTNSCVANAVCNAVRIARSLEGDPSPVLPSRLFAYFNSRSWHGSETKDQGTYLRACIKGLAKFGMPDESYWAFDTRKVNKRPPWNSYRMAHDFRGPAGYYRIHGRGDDRIRAIKVALKNGYPVVFGTAVARSFTAPTGEAIVDNPIGEHIIGGHAMVWVGYVQDGNGIRFETLNSWGTGWRLGGYCWMTEDYVRWRDTRDLWVIKL